MSIGHGALTVELVVYLKLERLIESSHNQHLPAVGLFPGIMDAADIELLGRTPLLDGSALEVLRAQEGVGSDLPPQILSGFLTDSKFTFCSGSCGKDVDLRSHDSETHQVLYVLHQELHRIGR
jgi:hypothetical protein